MTALKDASIHLICGS